MRGIFSLKEASSLFRCFFFLFLATATTFWLATIAGRHWNGSPAICGRKPPFLSVMWEILRKTSHCKYPVPVVSESLSSVCEMDYPHSRKTELLSCRLINPFNDFDESFLSRVGVFYDPRPKKNNAFFESDRTLYHTWTLQCISM